MELAAPRNRLETEIGFADNSPTEEKSSWVKEEESEGNRLDLECLRRIRGGEELQKLSDAIEGFTSLRLKKKKTEIDQKREKLDKTETAFRRKNQTEPDLINKNLKKKTMSREFFLGFT